jgi:GxxExxY protein
MYNRVNGNGHIEDALAKRVTGLAMEVHRTLGCGFLESIYCNALEIEFRHNNIPFEREKRFTVTYKGTEIGYFDADFLVDKRLVVEAKAIEALGIAHSVQLVNYLAAGKLELGLLLNFGAKSLEFKTKTRTYVSSFEPPNLQS